jgi:hypothetical protein
MKSLLTVSSSKQQSTFSQNYNVIFTSFTLSYVEDNIIELLLTFRLLVVVSVSSALTCPTLPYSNTVAAYCTDI